MKLSKNKENIIISNLKQTEIFALLKFQIPGIIKFSDAAGYPKEELDLTLTERVFENNVQMITVNEEVISYQSLIKQIQTSMSAGLTYSLWILKPIFAKNEPLLALATSIREEIIESCVYINYDREVFGIINKPLKNGDSDKMYYFEINNSILAFVKDGPVIIQDNPSINSIEDVIC